MFQIYPTYTAHPNNTKMATYKDLHDEMVKSIDNGALKHPKIQAYLENSKSISANGIMNNSMIPALDIAIECHLKADVPDVSCLCCSSYETIKGEDGHPVVLGQGKNGATFLGRCEDSNELVAFKLTWNKSEYSIRKECWLQIRAYQAMKDADEGELSGQSSQTARFAKVQGELSL